MKYGNENNTVNTDNVKKEAYNAIDTVEAKAKNKVDEYSDKASRLGDMYNKATDTVIDVADKVKSWGRQAPEQIEQLEGRIKDRPLASTAIAFGVGFVLSALFVGRRNRY